MAHNGEKADLDHQNTSSDFLTEEAFFTRGRGVLQHALPWVLNEVIPNLADRNNGRWHPIGFGVFPLKTLDDGSSLRLHVWAEGLRKSHSAGRTVHDHAWYLQSHVLTGTSEDVIYDATAQGGVSLSEEERKAAGLHRIFTAAYHPGQHQELTTDGKCARLDAVEHRQMLAGTFNEMPLGATHLDTIPIDKTVVTLCLDSPKIGEGPHIFIDGPPDPIRVDRPVIEYEDALRVQNIILGAFATQDSVRIS